MGFATLYPSYGPFLIILAIQAVATIVAMLMAPKPKNAAPSPVNGIPTTAQGTPIPIVFGHRRVTQLYVAWWGDVKADPIKTGGGKK